MQKEHGQVTGLIWRGPEDLCLYQELKNYATQQQLPVTTAAKQLIRQALQQKKLR